MNWYWQSKYARFNADWGEDEIDQLRPSYSPYSKKKSPNDLGPSRNRPFDGGDGLGDTRDFIEQYNDGMKHENLLDQYDEGAVQDSPALNGYSLIVDEPLSDGDGPLEGGLLPIGENKTTVRRAKEPLLDNKPNRLPNGGVPVKDRPQLRRSSSVESPLNLAWEHMKKKG